MRSLDTHPDAQREQIRLMRAAGPSGRFAAARSLSRTLFAVARRRVRERMPDATEPRLERALARRLYGEQIVRDLGIGTAAGS